MSNLTTKQKIILGIIISIMLIIIGIYGYTTLNKEDTGEELIENSVLDNNEQLKETIENEEQSKKQETKNENIENNSETSEQNTRKRKHNREQ